MAELLEILTMKVNKANELCKILTELMEKEFKKLSNEEKESLPRFSGKFDEKSLNEYIKELIRAIRNPIRFRRKKALIELGITGIENVKDEVFDNDDIEDTIQILQKLKSYERLFKILSPKIPSLLIQNSISNVNSQLEDIRNNIESLKKIEDIRSESVKDYCIRNFVSGELNIYEIDKLKGKVMTIEKTLNLQIKQEEIALIDEVYTLINDVKEYGKEFKKQCENLSDAKEGLKSFKDKLEEKYKQIKKELDFWHILCPEEYVPEIKNIDTLMNKLGELKRKCKEKYKSFSVLEQIYNRNLDEEIEDLRGFADKLEKIIYYFPDLEIRNKEDLNTVGKTYFSIEWLEKIKYPDVEELSKKFTFENINSFFEKVSRIKEEYGHLKEDLKAYQRILGIEEEQIDEYPLLKQKIDEYRNELRSSIGEGFESLIKFLKEEIEDIEVDEQTLKNFIKTVKPILKEALRI
ncbi:MAG: hypothetical protein B6U95_04010 [Thermofilum sp. ex4484_82]|nr:MAG: hypothetical protein B6U95_04010 [Thermofilum sp. ex4484_82]OYT38581.1 MAG: hypothetical protein B6U96_04005 [Archaeoglobales archaeon ex4484_92]